MTDNSDHTRPGADVARAITGRRPTPSRDFGARLHAATERPSPRTWVLPVVLAGVVAAMVIVVIAQRADHRPPVAEAPIAGVRTIPAPAGPSSNLPQPDVANLLASYQSLLETRDIAGLGLDPGQLARLRDIADALAKQRALTGAQREVAMIELRHELERIEIDAAKAAAIFDRVSGADAAIGKAELAARISARAVLTPRQRALIGRQPVVSTTTPPPATVPRTASVSITTDPPGGRVTIDGAVRGFAPIETQLAAGKHVVRIDHVGHASKTLSIDLAAGERREWSVELERKPAAPTSPTDCDEVSCILSNYDGACCAKYRLGTLRVAARPYGRVIVDGRDAGTTPLVLELPAGKHRIELVHQADKRSYVVNVEPSGAHSLSVDFSAAP